MTDRSEGPLRLLASARTDAPHPSGAGKAAGTTRPATTGPRTKAPARSRPQGVSPGEVVALLLSLTWLGFVGWFLLTLDAGQARLTRDGPLGFAATVLGVFLPVALIWVAASAARTARTMRAESLRLQAAIDALRGTHAEQRLADSATLRQALEEQIEQVRRTQAVLAAEVAALHARAAPEPILSAPRRPPVPEPQPSLALDTDAEVDPLPPEDFIRALDFPDNERDIEGFRVLRAALEHHTTAQLVTAAQHLLTLLSQDGIYMDDLTVHRADAVLWRAFAEGTHGSDLAALGGIRDRSSLALTGGRMKDDPLFREAVHHFLRTFDRVFAGFAAGATDAEVMRFADTRTARAFMLTARVAGTFA